MIVPHVLDQYYWGYRVWRSGLGPRPIKRSALGVRKLSKAVRCCVSDERIRERAEKTAGTIDRRASLERTVREIDMAARQ